MVFSRRNVLRDLSTLGALSTLPGALPLLAGCKSKPSAESVLKPQSLQATLPRSGKPNTLRILLEGPWIISRPGSTATALHATAAADSNHQCFCGLWDKNSQSIVDPVSGSGNPMQFVGPQQWDGKVQNSNVKNTFDTTLSVLRKSQAYIQDGSVQPASKTDIVLTLPFPDYVLLGGRFLSGKAPHQHWGDFIPHTTAVLGYEESPGKPLMLGFADTASPLHKIAVGSSNDIVFRLVHKGLGMPPAADAQHVIDMFAHSMGRISPKPNRVLALSNVCTDLTSVDTGAPIGPLELGLPATAPSYCQPQQAGMHIESTTFANCAGGVMGVGP